MLYIGNDQIYLDYEKIEKNKLVLNELTGEAIRVILRFQPLKKHLKRLMYLLSPSEKPHNLLLRGNHVKRAGDIYMIPNQGILIMVIQVQLMHWLSYDTHAPLLMMGRGIKSGRPTK